MTLKAHNFEKERITMENRDGMEGLAAREAVRDIQPPTEGTGDVWGDLIAMRGPSPLRDAMVARRALGIERYGRPLRYGDGRGPVDALQEALDLAAYLVSDGWHVLRIDGERRGQKRTFSKQQAEYLTLSRPPVARPGVQVGMW